MCRPLRETSCFLVTVLCCKTPHVVFRFLRCNDTVARGFSGEGSLRFLIACLSNLIASTKFAPSFCMSAFSLVSGYLIFIIPLLLCTARERWFCFQISRTSILRIIACRLSNGWRRACFVKRASSTLVLFLVRPVGFTIFLHLASSWGSIVTFLGSMVNTIGDTTLFFCIGTVSLYSASSSLLKTFSSCTAQGWWICFYDMSIGKVHLLVAFCT